MTNVTIVFKHFQEGAHWQCLQTIEGAGFLDCVDVPIHGSGVCSLDVSIQTAENTAANYRHLDLFKDAQVIHV